MSSRYVHDRVIKYITLALFENFLRRKISIHVYSLLKTQSGNWDTNELALYSFARYECTSI